MTHYHHINRCSFTCRCIPCECNNAAMGQRTPAITYIRETDEEERIYVICINCGYEKEWGIPCGEPCV